MTQLPAVRVLGLFVRRNRCFSFPSSLEVTKREKGHGGWGTGGVGCKFLSPGLCHISLRKLTACGEGDGAKAGPPVKACRSATVSSLEMPKIGHLALFRILPLGSVSQGLK